MSNHTFQPEASVYGVAFSPHSRGLASASADRMVPPELPEDLRLVPRRLAKQGLQVTCRMGTLGLGQNIALSVFDISEMGLRLSVKSALAKDQEIEVELLAPGRSRPLKLSAKVVWSSPADDGFHWVGAEFRHPLSYAEIRDLIKT